MEYNVCFFCCYWFIDDELNEGVVNADVLRDDDDDDDGDEATTNTLGLKSLFWISSITSFFTMLFIYSSTFYYFSIY